MPAATANRRMRRAGAAASTGSTAITAHCFVREREAEQHGAAERAAAQRGEHGADAQRAAEQLLRMPEPDRLPRERVDQAQDRGGRARGGRLAAAAHPAGEREAEQSHRDQAGDRAELVDAQVVAAGRAARAPRTAAARSARGCPSAAAGRAPWRRRRRAASSSPGRRRADSRPSRCWRTPAPWRRPRSRTRQPRV